MMMTWHKVKPKLKFKMGFAMETLLEGRTALFNRVSGRVGSLRLSYE